MSSDSVDTIFMFLCGDVMTGRGIDQVLSRPGNPALHEPYVRDARDYVELAESIHGPIPRNVDFAYVWGDALAELRAADPDVRIINLETSITCSEDCWPDKPVLYRMHPENIACLTTAGIDCCCLANNHVLDWGYAGLAETLRTLNRAGVAHAGAGRSAAEAAAPATLDVAGKGRVLVLALGSVTSGIPFEWRATGDRPGVNVLDDLSVEVARRVGSRIRQLKRPGDVTIASIHWGNNWGYDIPDEQIRFAHRLIEEGVDVVHGHSSHHVKAIEIYRKHLILYGCGDFITDYEGITGYESYRSDLALMYLAKFDPGDGRVVETRLIPLQAHRFRLRRASASDATWLCELLNNLGSTFDTHVQLADKNSIDLRWR